MLNQWRTGLEDPQIWAVFPKMIQKSRRVAKVYATGTDSAHPFSKAFEVVAWALRYKSILRERAREKDKKSLLSDIHVDVNTIRPTSVNEFNKAEREILRLVQIESYRDELKRVKHSEQSNCQRKPKLIKKSSPIYKSDPILVNDLLCVGGRLQQAPIDNEAKHPIIPPKRHYSLLVRHFHDLPGYSGIEHTLSLTRRRYWIVKGRSSVRSIVNHCFDCKR